MTRWHRKDGFTLVEFLVGLVAAALVIGAAVTILLLSIKMGAFGGGAAQRQNGVLTVQNMLLKSASVIDEITVELADGDTVTWRKADPAQRESLLVTEGGITCWEILQEDKPLLTFRDSSVFVGTDSELIDNVVTTRVSMEPGSNSYLLVLELEVDGKSYTIAVSCDAPGGAVTPPAAAGTLLPAYDTSVAVNSTGLLEQTQRKLESGAWTSQERIGRETFLQILFSQLGSTGQILGEEEDYFSRWYIGTYAGSGWNADTPWCACYISWALDRTDALKMPIRFADVQDGVTLMQKNATSNGQLIRAGWREPSEADPQPGDLVFFDKHGNGGAHHVGVVLFAEAGYLYTIEGNVDDAVQTVRYQLQDTEILGYGVLPWLQ